MLVFPKWIRRTPSQGVPPSADVCVRVSVFACACVHVHSTFRAHPYHTACMYCPHLPSLVPQSSHIATVGTTEIFCV